MDQAREINGKTRLAGFFANPAKHSISPLMHNTAFSLLGINARYLAFELPSDGLKRAIQTVRDFDMLGVNISMPFKIEAMSYMDELSDSARLSGSMNTVVNREGKLIGYNTDGSGFFKDLSVRDISVVGQTMTVLGCGGAASAIVAQAALDGAKKIYVFNRKGASFDSFRQRLALIHQTTNCQIELVPIDDLQMLAHAIDASRLLANATSLGMKPHENQLPLPEESLQRLQASTAVVDIIYNPFETKLLTLAKEKGCQTANGLGMLLYQGADAFELWTGQKMPTEEIYPLVLKEKTKK